MILEVCEIIRAEQKINTVALSGGVFQNTLLMERTLKILRDRHFNVYYNMSVPQMTVQLVWDRRLLD